MKTYIAFCTAALLVTSCKENKENTLDKETITEQIQIIQTNETTTKVIDSLQNEIQASAQKLDELLKEIE